MTATPRVVVAGAGFAGLEAAFLLRMRLGGRVHIDLVSESPRFVFRPNSIYVPFGADPEDLVVDLEKPLRRRRIPFVQGRVQAVDTDARTVELDDGRRLPFDHLVIATGAAMRPDEVPGLADHACTIWTTDEMLALRGRIDETVRRAASGSRQRVLFAVPPANKCSGPLYEMVFMLETWLRRKGVREAVDIAYRTYEHSYIQAFGPRLHDVVTGEFAERGIDGRTETVLAEVRPGEAVMRDGTVESFDLLIAFPPYVAAMRWEGLPADDRGFLRTDLATRQVAGCAGVYAPGDAGDFPVKQAFLAFLQADAVAERVAAEVTGTPADRGFDPVSMCVMEMLDSATFAQVPLRVTGDPDRPVEVRPDAGDDYKVGVSPAWRVGKKMLGFYLPMRFGAGEPFHAGAGWQMMDLGLKGMVKVLAD
ncbi:MAG: NAD(P)/FAD-dependent oxidoreductase [Thermoleophilia bacterium]